MEIDVIIYIATTPKDSSGVEAWASLTDYGTSRAYGSGVVIHANNNQTLLEAVLHSMSSISRSEYSPTVFIVGGSYVVKTLNKLGTGVPLHRVQVKPLRNTALWKELQFTGLTGVYWKSVSADNLPGSREVVHLADTLLKKDNNVDKNSTI